MNKPKGMSFQELEHLMKTVPGFWKYREREPQRCETCFFYCPDFKYRICRFTRCAFGKACDVYRRKPLETEFYRREVKHCQNQH